MNYKEMYEKVLEENKNLKKRVHDLEKIANTDELTSLFNRRIIPKEEDRFSAVIMCDIDDLKSVNDTFGHARGDKLLKQVSEILKLNIRVGDSAVRCGGDEFIIILANCDEEETLEKAETIRKEIIKMSAQWPFDITMSFGVSIKQNYKPLRLVIDEADEALYTSKVNGKNCVTLYTVDEEDDD